MTHLTFLNDEINDVATARAFLIKLTEAGMNFHPDDDVTDIEWGDIKMSDEQLAALDAAMNKIHVELDVAELCIYTEMMAASINVDEEDSPFWREEGDGCEPEEAQQRIMAERGRIAQTRITFKNLIVSDELSRENTCFRVSVYFDDDLAATVMNHGIGEGNDEKVHDSDAYKCMCAYLIELPAVEQKHANCAVQPDLDMVVDQYIADHRV